MNSEKNIDEISDLEELIKVGKELAEKKEFDNAKKFISKALSINPENLNALNAMGFANGRSGDYPEAIKYYKKALEIEPAFQKALGNLAHVLEMQGNYVEAIKYYEKALEVKPEDENLRFPDEIIKVVKDHLQKCRELAK